MPTPGEVLFGLMLRDAERTTGIPRQLLRAVIDGSAGLSPRRAEVLARRFGHPNCNDLEGRALPAPPPK